MVAPSTPSFLTPLGCQIWEPQEFRPKVHLSNSSGSTVQSGKVVTVRGGGQTYLFRLDQSIAPGGTYIADIPYHIYMNMGTSCTASA